MKRFEHVLVFGVKHSQGQIPYLLNLVFDEAKD